MAITSTSARALRTTRMLEGEGSCRPDRYGWEERFVKSAMLDVADDADDFHDLRVWAQPVR